MIPVTRSAPDFDRLSELLQELDALQSAAELHGFVTGQLAGGRRFSRSEWLQTVNDTANLGTHPDQKAGDGLYALYQQTLADLSNGELAFQPLLPADDAPLVRRVESLGQWCQGFLQGFGLAGGKTSGNDELAETLRDLAAIAQVGCDETDSEQSESDLFAVCEYVRLSAVDIFWQHNPGTRTETNTPDAGTDPGSIGGSAGETARSPASLFQRTKLH